MSDTYTYFNCSNGRCNFYDRSPLQRSGNWLYYLTEKYLFYKHPKVSFVLKQPYFLQNPISYSRDKSFSSVHTDFLSAFFAAKILFVSPFDHEMNQFIHFFLYEQCSKNWRKIRENISRFFSIFLPLEGCFRNLGTQSFTSLKTDLHQEVWKLAGAIIEHLFPLIKLPQMFLAFSENIN